MKKRYAGLLLGITITLGSSLLSGCADKGNTSDAGETIYGQVSEINGETITIELGTQKEMERPDNQDGKDASSEENHSDETDADAENKAPDLPDGMEEGEIPPNGGQPSMLELTGEEQDIKVQADTVIKHQSMGSGNPGGMGEAPGGGAPEESQEEITLEDIEEGNTIAVTLDEDGDVSEILVMSSGGMGQPDGVESYSAAEEYTDDTEIDGESITSTGTDENAAHIYEGASVVLKNITFTRTSSDSTGGDNSSFYGVGAAVLDTDGVTYISGSTIETDAAGGSYTSNGTGSPAVYSTADIAVNNAALTANGSEAVCIEGMNSLHLYDCSLTGNMSDNDQNDCTWNVILYQSMSGDSEAGNSTFEMKSGTLTAKNGGMFYTTNTESTITLSGVDIQNADDSEFFLRCTGNNNQRGWGTAGENGADCLFTAVSQTMEGDVIWDSISKLDFYITEGSTLTGAVLDDETYAGDGGDGYCNLYIAEGSTWTVTKDSVLSVLSSTGTVQDPDGKSVTIKGSDGTVYVEGDSKIVVTVDTYDTKGDVSGALAATDWSAYETEKPSHL